MIKKALLIVVLFGALGVKADQKADEKVLLNPELKNVLLETLNKNTAGWTHYLDHAPSAHVLRQLVSLCQENNKSKFHSSKLNKAFDCKILDDLIVESLSNNDCTYQAYRNEVIGTSAETLFGVSIVTSLIGTPIIASIPLASAAALYFVFYDSEQKYISQDTKDKLIQLKKNIDNATNA
jgi:hypothetical protein